MKDENNFSTNWTIVYQKKKKNYLNWESFNQISLNKKYKIQSNIIEMQMYG